MVAAHDEADLRTLIGKIRCDTDGATVSLRDLKDALGNRAFGPLFVMVALIAILPTGAIPGVSIITGSVMLLLSAQLLLGATTIWLPKSLEERAIPRDKLLSSVDKAEPFAARVDRWIRPRLTKLVRPPFVQLMAVAGILISVSMFPLALVPFGAFPAGLSMLLIGLALAVRDGVLAILGIAIGAGALIFAASALIG